MNIAKSVEESVLDKPREDGLNKTLWNVDQDGNNPTLTEEAKNKIFFIIKWMTDGETKLSEYGVNLVGSMTSNSYSDSSDIDLHFNSSEIVEDDAESFNKTFTERFKNEFKTIFEENDWTIGGHPIEVYFQVNPTQDLMSVGCYDVLNDEWIVGPDVSDAEFDPYKQYYQDDMEYVQDIIEDIRNVILECFESAIVIRNSSDENFKKFEMNHLVDKMAKAGKIFTDVREYRKIKSSPRTEEQAKFYRDSKEWKIADSAFKLLDKFGYLGILRTLTQCYEKIKSGEMTEEQSVEEIIQSITQNFSANKNLNENEIVQFREIQGEGIKDIVKYAMLFGTLASPLSDVDASTVKDKLDGASRQQVSMLNNMIGDLNYSQTQNIVAWTIWTEARGEYKRNGIKSLNAIASVIWNRANKDPQNFSKVISMPKQFSWWNGYEGGFEQGTYEYQIPSEEELKNPINLKIWNLCNQIANDMIEGNFKSTIGNRNMIANKGKDNPDAWNSWGKNADYKIGNHTFGYERYWDGAIRYGRSKAVGGNQSKVASKKQNIYRIRKGDTIGKIAKLNNTTVQDILKKNPSIRNANKIYIGQKIFV